MTDASTAEPAVSSAAPTTPFGPDVRPAIVHDWFQGFHGAERVVDALVGDVFARARTPDIYTFHAAHEVIPEHLSMLIARESRLGRLPGLRQRDHTPGAWRYLLPTMPRWFRGLSLDDYDIVVSSSHACAVNVVPRHATHVCYCHTPMRYAWTPEIDGERGRGLERVVLGALRGSLRRTDLEASRRVDAYVANSSAVRDRIRRFYGRESEVIPPPVDVSEFRPRTEKDPDRFLWVHRLVPYKQPLLVAEAFRELPYRLTMVGVGPLEAKVRANLPPNVELRGWTSRRELTDLYSSSAAFIHVGEEDFGISMVEALAAGMPVVGYGRGGACDIVRPGIDGVLVDRVDLSTVRAAVREVAERSWDPAALARRAEDFSRQRFSTRFGDFAAEVHAGLGRG